MRLAFTFLHIIYITFGSVDFFLYICYALITNSKEYKNANYSMLYGPYVICIFVVLGYSNVN